MQDPLVGRLLDSRYRVEARLARGGMATVYTAVDTRLDRTVAVKVMHPALALDETFVARFIREARSAARLSHPNVVAVQDQGSERTEDGAELPWLAMELVEGRTLRDVLREYGRLSPRQAFDVLEPVLAALAAAHRAGLVHRDVKPENVLLADDGRVKVADFGLARAAAGGASAGATTGLLIGTVAYLAPEQVERSTADARSDVYSAGILLFELLTGAPPYDGDSPLQVAYRHVHDDVPAPSSRVPGLPPAVDELVRTATRRSPDERPADAAQLLAAVVAARRALPGTRPDAAVPAPRVVAAYPMAGDATTPDSTALETVALDTTALDAGATDAGTVEMAAPDTRGSDGDPDALPARNPDAPRHEPLQQTVVAPQHVAPRPRGRLLLAAALLLVLLGGGAGAGTWWYTAGPGAWTSTPAVLGVNAESARAELATAGLGLRLDDAAEYSETVPAGEVVRTEPAPGERVRKDGTVTAVLSRGPERYDVPDVSGLPLAEARSALAERTLRVGRTTEAWSERVPEGEVVSQRPGPGAEPVRRDTPVDVVVSKGREPIAVPAVAGEPRDRAEDAVERAGLEVEVTGDWSETIPAGRVITQNPPRGPLHRGDVVHLVVSKGPPLVEVPHVLDQRSEEARRTLEAAGFRVETQGTRILDRVLAQSEVGGEKIPKGSTVTLTTV